MKIFHYTSIETLALILKNRTLRFNNVANVNDPDEAMTDDFGSLQPYCFTSCWTSRQEESIPLWKIYGNNGHGVRIESDTSFIHFRNDSVSEREMYFVVKNVQKNNLDSCFINLWQSGDSFNHYFRTHYSDVNRIFEKNLSTNSITQFEYDIESAFNTKKTCWAFEEEIRFILLGCNSSIEKCDNWQIVFNRIMSKSKSKRNFHDSYVDLILEQDFFDNLKITCSPKIDDAEKIIIQALVEKFDENKKIKITESKINMK